MPGNLEKICTFSWVGDENPAEEVSGVWCDVFWEGEGSGNDVFVQKIDVVALGVCWVVIEREVTGKHGILANISLTVYRPWSSYQNDTAAPDVDLAAGVERIANDEFGCRIARASAARLHQITSSIAAVQNPVKLHLLDVVFGCQVVLDLVAKLVGWIEHVCEAKVSDDDVTITVEQQIFQLQIAVHDAFLVQVAYSRNQLGEQTARSIVFQVPMVQNVVEKLSTRCVLQNDAYLPFGLHHLV